VLWLVTTDDDQGTMGTVLSAFSNTVASWVWIPWIPQLLSALMRKEASHAYRVLWRIARRHPQALFYALRAFRLEHMDGNSHKLSKDVKVEQAAATIEQNVSLTSSTTTLDSSTTPRVPSQQNSGIPGKSVASSVGNISSAPKEDFARKVPSASKFADELFHRLRHDHASLVSELHRMAEEMMLKFKPEPEEELMSAIHALLMKSHKATDSTEIPKFLKCMLQHVSDKFFSRKIPQKSESCRTFVDTFQTTFNSTFLPKTADGQPNAEYPRDLGCMIEKLQIWQKNSFKTM
jgi:transformation/transcription domain-associated protein